MKYIKDKNCIIIQDLTEFDINQILDCGQIFRYEIFNEVNTDRQDIFYCKNKIFKDIEDNLKNNDIVEDRALKNMAIVVSTNKFACVVSYNDRVEIFSKDIDYFAKFFDLDTNYSKIKKQLIKDDFLRPCCDYGFGIRILKQNLFEMIVSFIISANNNIGRIKKSLNYLAKNYGQRIEIGFDIPNDIFARSNLIIKENEKGFYYAFPTLDDLKKLSVKDYEQSGLGYRSQQMYKTIQFLTNEHLENFSLLSKEEKDKFLLSLYGVGEKVKNCIMLFAEYDMTSFPVDTWINKVYNALTKTNTTNRELIKKDLISRYGNLSGYAQQYFFYYYRENKLMLVKDNSKQ